MSALAAIDAMLLGLQGRLLAGFMSEEETQRLLNLSGARAAIANSAAELRDISKAMRDRRINNGRNASPTLIAWADRIDAALVRLGGAA